MARQAGADSYMPLLDRTFGGVEGLTGQQLLQARRANRMKLFGLLFVGYLGAGCIIFYLIEGWGPFNSLVFCLSILTGVGYGHLIPQYDSGKLLTALFIIVGLMVFASVAGQILDYVMAKEIEAVEAMMESAQESEEDPDKALSYHEQREQDKKTQFLTGIVNASALYTLAVVLYCLVYGEGVVSAIYLASISVMKLDSLCLLDGVQCSAGWHAHGGGKALDTTLAIIWYFITCGIIGHFMVSAANYFGLDPEARMTKIKKFNEKRLLTLDKDKDGTVTRSEFLRDRLITAGICTEEQLAPIFKNFDDLDKDGSGVLTKKDIETLTKRDAAS